MSVTFLMGDYWYNSPNDDGKVQAWVDDDTKEYYAEIPKTVTYNNSTYTVDSLRDCFLGCSNLKVAPVIPSTTTNMYRCFKDCTSLSGDIYIMTSSVSLYDSCFAGITNNVTIHGADALTLERLKSTNPNHVYINTTPTALPSIIECTPMNYMIDSGLIQLSPQTDASLVSVQVPNGSGTITTTLEDALVDLYNRMSPPTIYTTSLNSEVTSNGLTFTPIGNGEIRVSGTSTDNVRVRLIYEPIIKGARYKLTGCPNMGLCGVSQNFFSYNLGYMIVTSYISNNTEQNFTSGSLDIISNIKSGRIFNNVIIKPELQLVGDV